MSANRQYATAELSAFYAQHRIGWDSLYPSEQRIFAGLPLTASSRVVDLGCACGGLGVALRERFGITDYTGVDIHAGCIEVAPRICPGGRFLAGDFLALAPSLGTDHDLGCSLGAADWNVRTEDLLRSLFDCLRTGGHLVFSCRLTSDPKVAACLEAQQAITFGERLAGGAVEYAPYKVYRLDAILRLIAGLGPVRQITGYGYWGQVPPSVQGLPWPRVFYIVFAVQRGSAGEAPRLLLDVTADLLLPE